MMLENFAVTEDNWRDALAAAPTTSSPRAPTSRSRSRRATSGAPSPRSPSDAGRSRWNQQSVTSGHLATEYGFTDVDGSQPDVWTHIEALDDAGSDATV